MTEMMIVEWDGDSGGMMMMMMMMMMVLQLMVA